ncbi:hypothetical protein Patl1_24995 [Pistacia atlantica]|uniref:Uncharacterized protein n=1 Tax=Pistacia atlantica TaxID=434234 RepID=A0ACC1B185_9ROSI|nr:hypothetical protein Patl1_24995 [Pistacia atlantica]
MFFFFFFKLHKAHYPIYGSLCYQLTVIRKHAQISASLEQVAVGLPNGPHTLLHTQYSTILFYSN